MSRKASPKRKTNAAVTPHAVVSTPQPAVMIVDDDADLLATARLLLERHGLHVETRSSSPSWEDLGYVKPCVVFMDVQLGPEDGAKACEAIKENPRYRTLPVILVSGLDKDRLADAARDAHADGFLSKPYRGGLLVDLARYYAQQAKAA